MISGKKSTVYLSVGKKKTSVWIYGNLKNPIILFIHGIPIPFSRMTGDLPIKYLQNEYCIVAFDLPGFGVSKDISVDHETFIDAVINRVSPKRKVSLFGSSFGGMVAFRYAYLNPTKIRNVIIAGTPFYSQFIVNFLKIISSFKPRQFLKIIDYVVFLNKHNLSSLKMPILLLYSGNDKLATVQMGRKLESLLENSTYIESSSRTHSWLLHRVDKSGFLESIKTFLKNNSS